MLQIITLVTLPEPPGFKLGGETVGGIISKIVPLVLVAAGFLLLIMLIISGYQLITSRGDPKALESAKGRILFSLIGFLLVFAAFWIVSIVQQLFKIQLGLQAQ